MRNPSFPALKLQAASRNLAASPIANHSEVNPLQLMNFTKLLPA